MPEFNSASFYDWLDGAMQDVSLRAERGYMTNWSRKQLGGSPVVRGPLDHPPIDPFADELHPIRLRQIPATELNSRLNKLTNTALSNPQPPSAAHATEVNAITNEMVRRHIFDVNTPNLGPLDPPLGPGGAALTALGLRAGMSMDNFRTQKSSVPHFAASALAGAGIPRNWSEARGMWQHISAPVQAAQLGDPMPMIDEFANMASSMYDAATHPREIIQHLWENIKSDPIGTAGFMTGALAGMVRGPKKIDARLLRNAEANAAAREAAAAGKIVPPEVPTVPAPETLAQPKLPFPDPATAAPSAGIPSLEDETSGHAIAGRRALPLPQGINSMDDLRAALQGGAKLSPEYMDRSRAWLWGVLTPSQRLKLLNSRMGPMYQKLAKPGDLGEMGR